MTTPTRSYVSNGRVLDSPPLTARVRQFMDDSYRFVGLYLTTLFSLDPYAAAAQSPYNVHNRNRPSSGGSRQDAGPRSGGGGGGGGGGGSGPYSGGGGGGGSGKKLGTIDDVRGPECKSCG